jgi:ionotropic glutamate receptor
LYFPQVGLMTAYHNYIVTSLDLHLVELEDFKYSGTNITAFRLVNPDLDEVQKVTFNLFFLNQLL